MEDDQKKRNDEREDVKDEIDDMQTDLEMTTNDISEYKGTLKELNEKMSMRMMDLETCNCKEKKFLLAQTTKFASLVAAHSSSKDGRPMYMKIEDLEAKKNSLNEELTDETGSFGMEQRNLLHQMDMVEAKMNRQSAKAEMYEHTDANMAKGTNRQSKAMSAYLDGKKAQLERIEKDVKAAQDKYDDLEKAMGKCGCGPKGF